MHVIDADCHIIEYLPALSDLLRDLKFHRAADALTSLRMMPARKPQRFMATWWGTPNKDADARAAGFAPALLHARMAEQGVAVALIHSTLGLSLGAVHDTDSRVQLAMGLNRYAVEVTEGLGDKIIPSAVVPMSSPSDACEVVRDAASLGFRCVLLEAPVWRFSKIDGPPEICAVGHGSNSDYGPLWDLLCELRLAPVFHASGMGWGSRASTENFIFNHLGAFAAGSDYVLRTLIFAGVFADHPTLNLAFLECGSTWFLKLLLDLQEHWYLRGPHAINRLDPAALDTKALRAALLSSGPSRVRANLQHLPDALTFMQGHPPASTDEFHCMGMSMDQLIRSLCDRIYLGTSWKPSLEKAWSSLHRACGFSVRRLYSTDFGHWDGSDPLSADELTLALDRFNRDDLEDLLWRNTLRFCLSMNPDFFRGTTLEEVAENINPQAATK